MGSHLSGDTAARDGLLQCRFLVRERVLLVEQVGVAARGRVRGLSSAGDAPAVPFGRDEIAGRVLILVGHIVVVGAAVGQWWCRVVVLIGMSVVVRCGGRGWIGVRPRRVGVHVLPRVLAAVVVLLVVVGHDGLSERRGRVRPVNSERRRDS